MCLWYNYVFLRRRARVPAHLPEIEGRPREFLRPLQLHGMTGPKDDYLLRPGNALRHLPVDGNELLVLGANDEKRGQSQ